MRVAIIEHAPSIIGFMKVFDVIAIFGEYKLHIMILGLPSNAQSSRLEIRKDDVDKFAK